jgi:uncharacterized membrane protein YkvA (DUF1232 family)
MLNSTNGEGLAEREDKDNRRRGFRPSAKLPRVGIREAVVPTRFKNTSLAHRIRVDVHAAWLAARDKRAPSYARVFGLLLTAYALSPIDLIPDFIPVLGLLDDAILLPIGVWLFVKMLPEGLFAECRLKAEAASERPNSTMGVLIVIALWVIAAWLLWRLLAYWYN